MVQRFLQASLIVMLSAVIGNAQQGYNPPPIVQGGGSPMFSTASYLQDAGGAGSASNGVYTPVAAVAAGNSYSAGGSYGCDSGCDVGYGDCGDCGSCQRYVSLFGGWNRLLDYNGQIPQLNTLVNATFEDGYGVGGAIGRQFTPRLRSELESSYRYNDCEDASIVGGLTAQQSWTGPLDGEIKCFSGMANVYCDFGSRTMGRITPYLGAGAGVAFIEGDAQANGFQFAVDESTFAYQGIAGLLFPMGQRADWFCEYRYFATDTVSVRELTFDTSSPFDYRAHNIFFGLRFCR